MNAEDTKCGRSIVSDTLQCLTDQAKLCREKIDLLEAGQQLSRSEVVGDLSKLLDLCQNLRDAIASEDSAATWNSKDELHSLVSRLDETAAKRRRYLDLAQLLASGTVLHRRERTRQERLAQRDAAVAELMEISSLPSFPHLPGPVVDQWLKWALSLEDGSNAPDLLNLKSNFPRLDDFVRPMEIEQWQDGGSLGSVEISNPPTAVVEVTPVIAAADYDVAPEPVATPEPSSQISLGETASEEEAFDEHVEQAVSAPSATDVEEPSAELDEPSSSIATAQLPIVVAEEEQISVSETPLSDDSERLSFFSAHEIEAFARSIAEAKSDPNAPRKVRALLAVSHWLLPRDQNPVLNSECGIRAQLNDASTDEVVIAAPEDAARIIDTADGLPLLAGGADLLRWGLTQYAGHAHKSIASVRRFSIEKLKQWFGELYKIQLADQQFHDIYMLTSGIPLLVGEMHRLIIPHPEVPPAWLGHARWIEIKTSYGFRLAALAQEMRDGAPAVRLRRREIAVLKMVNIASNDSTPETIASNLSEFWHQYNRPELDPLSVADEASVELLQNLGLLPMRTEPGLSPIKALLPLASNDALRQFVRYL